MREEEQGRREREKRRRGEEEKMNKVGGWAVYKAIFSTKINCCRCN
jgi:hypothetical protein